METKIKQTKNAKNVASTNDSLYHDDFFRKQELKRKDMVCNYHNFQIGNIKSVERNR